MNSQGYRPGPGAHFKQSVWTRDAKAPFCVPAGKSIFLQLRVKLILHFLSGRLAQGVGFQKGGWGLNRQCLLAATCTEGMWSATGKKKGKKKIPQMLAVSGNQQQKVLLLKYCSLLNFEKLLL